MSRRCTKCPTSSMPPNVRHLHELRAGDRLRFRGGPETSEYVLLALGDSRCEIGQPPRKVTTTITRQRKGKTVLSSPETVSFEKMVTGRTSCAGCAEVEPMLDLDEQLGRTLEETYLDHGLTCECESCTAVVEGKTETRVLDLMAKLRESLNG